MNWVPILTAVLTLLFLVVTALLSVLIRVVVKATRTEDKISELADDVKQLITDKDKVHAEMLGQMRFDRDATDKRLRYLEEFFMRHGFNQK